MSTTPRAEEQKGNEPSTPKTVRRPPRRAVIEHWLDQLRETAGHIPESETMLELEEIYTDDHPFDLSAEEIARLLNEGGEIPEIPEIPHLRY